MNKCQFLETADAIRKERYGRLAPTNRRTGFNMLQSATSMFDAKVKSLNAAERSGLLTTLVVSLERERRRCKGRKPDYDPGRHICLYAAVKALQAETTKPPA